MILVPVLIYDNKPWILSKRECSRSKFSARCRIAIQKIHFEVRKIVQSRLLKLMLYAQVTAAPATSFKPKDVMQS